MPVSFGLDLDAVLTVQSHRVGQLPWPQPFLLIHLAIGFGAWIPSAAERAQLQQLPPDWLQRLELNRRHGSIVAVEEQRSHAPRQLDPTEVERLEELFVATGLPHQPPQLTIDDNQTGSFSESITLHGVASGHPFLFRYSGLCPFRAHGSHVVAWCRFANALLSAAKVANRPSLTALDRSPF